MIMRAHLSLSAQILLIAAVAAIFFFHSACEAANELYAIRSWSSPSATRIVLDIKQRAAYKILTAQKPEHIIIELADFGGRVPAPTVPINDGIVKIVRASRTDSKTIRISIELEKPASTKVFQLEKFMDKPQRLAVDIIRQDLERADTVHREETRKLKQRDTRIVVIDPGHGGEDPGALSPRGTKEKDIVLSIARKTVQLLNKDAGIRAYLTRKSDYFIPLGSRINIAREYGADLFVSIHADSSFSSKPHGTSVYCLSPKGASSNTAQMLAQKENASDLIGGVPLDHTNDDLTAIIVDLVQTNTLNSSITCAGLLLREVGKVNTLRSDRPQQACFRVLRDPNIPSMLIETDFLSNPKKEKKLKSEEFQNCLAGAIAAAVTKYAYEVKPRPSAEPPPTEAAGKQPAPKKFLKEPPAKASREKPQKSSPQIHTVKKGETLNTIARKYHTTPGRLRALNGLTSARKLKAGMKLKVPAEAGNR